MRAQHLGIAEATGEALPGLGGSRLDRRELDGVAEMGEATDEPPGLDLLRTPVEMVRAEVLVGRALLEHVVGGGEDRGGRCSLMAGQALTLPVVATMGRSCRIMVLSAVGIKPPHDGVGSVGLVMSTTRSSDLVDPSRNNARAMANASSRQGQLSAWWRISSSFYLWFMLLAPWSTSGTRCRRAAGDGG